MVQLLVIARHGEYGPQQSSPLSEVGRKQMVCLRKVIDAFVMKIFGTQNVVRISFSFSRLPRAFESIGFLRHFEDVVATSLGMTKRSDIDNPQKILDKVMKTAEFYDASIATIVAHGDMPAVIAETAHERITGKKYKQLPSVDIATGYIINMTTGEVVPIRYDDLDAKPTPPPAKGHEDFEDDLPF